MAVRSEARLDDVLGQFALVDGTGFGDFQFSGRLTHDPETDRLSLAVIDPDPFTMLSSGGAHASVEGLLGITERNGVVLLNMTSVGATGRFGGSGASVKRFGCLTALSGADLSLFSGLEMSEAAAVFPKGLSWAGMSAVSDHVTHDAQGRVQQVDLKVASVGGPLKVGLSHSRALELDADWSVNPADAGRRIDAGLRVMTSAKRARSAEQLIQPILMVQDLLAIAYRSPVLASSAQARLRNYNEPSQMWDWRLFSDNAHVGRSPEQRDDPRFRIHELGGAAGVARWVTLVETHPRAVAPLRHHRVGAGTPSSRLLEIASAIEYWVAVHRKKKVAWARRGGTHAEAVALNAGRPFVDFVDGRVSKWSTLFWSTYNNIKHNPTAVFDNTELHLLALSGLFLLEMAMLNRCAGSQAPGRALQADHWARSLSTAVVGELL